MDAEPPQRTDGPGRYKRTAIRALLFAAVGTVAVVGTAVAFTLRAISVKLAIILGLPAVVLMLSGLTVALLSDPETAERQGFRVGLTAGSLRRLWRSAFDRDHKDGH